MIRAVIVAMLFGIMAARSVFPEEKVITEQQKFARNLESLQLRKIPRRIYLAGEDIIKRYHTTDEKKNLVEIKFAYELVQPTACELLKPTFGCCWDNKTAAMGLNGKGSPVCQDRKRSCRKWTEYCHEVAVREVCPESCQACPKKPSNCLDAKDQKEFCPMYAKFGLCKRRQIRVHCKNTCNACEEK